MVFFDVSWKVHCFGSDWAIMQMPKLKSISEPGKMFLMQEMRSKDATRYGKCL